MKVIVVMMIIGDKTDIFLVELRCLIADDYSYYGMLSKHSDALLNAKNYFF